jgi:hypothetical protein
MDTLTCFLAGGPVELVVFVVELEGAAALEELLLVVVLPLISPSFESSTLGLGVVIVVVVVVVGSPFAPLNDE